jgi:hypothetical protein
MQVPAVQVPLVHGVPLLQQGEPGTPHKVHSLVLAEHVLWVPLQMFPGQQASPSLPHGSQTVLPLHTSLVCEQAAPLATHLAGFALSSQQAVPVHCAPGQHGWPAPPQASHAVPVHTDEAPEHDSPAKTHIWPCGSQQPCSHAVPVLQQGPPENPQLFPMLESPGGSVTEIPPSDGLVSHDDDDVPDTDALAPCSTQVIVQLEPPPLDVHVTPPVDSVPHRQIACPLMVAVQQLEEDPEQPDGIMTVRTSPRSSMTTYRIELPSRTLGQSAHPHRIAHRPDPRRLRPDRQTCVVPCP